MNSVDLILRLAYIHGLSDPYLPQKMNCHQKEILFWKQITVIIRSNNSFEKSFFRLNYQVILIGHSDLIGLVSTLINLPNASLFSWDAYTSAHAQIHGFDSSSALRAFLSTYKKESQMYFPLEFVTGDSGP